MTTWIHIAIRWLNQRRRGEIGGLIVRVKGVR
jgi:hypothetical protein